MSTIKIEVEQEEDGRWLTEVLELPGALAYGQGQEAAVSSVQTLALRVVAERLEHGETGPQLSCGLHAREARAATMATPHLMAQSASTLCQ